MRINLPFLLMLVLSLTTCVDQSPKLSGTFHGFWYETSFDFTFYANGEFIMETGGHFGQTTTHGEYTLLDTTVFLLPDSDDVLDNNFGIHISKLRYDLSTDCLVDFKDNLYCQEHDQLFKLGEERYELQQEVEKYLLELPEVETYISTKTDTTGNFVSRPKIEFDYIRTLKRRHYWQYRLMIGNPDAYKELNSYFLPARISPFLVDVKTLKIYREERSVDMPLRYEGEVPQ